MYNVRLQGNVPGSVKVSCCTQPHDSTMVQETLFGLARAEARWLVRWPPSYVQFGTAGTKLRATPHRPNQNPISDWRRAVHWHCWRARKPMRRRVRVRAGLRKSEKEQLPPSVVRQCFAKAMPISRVNPTHEKPRYVFAICHHTRTNL